jgi:dimeric dUTPase (all-alpha-NTP-PPase superfamily)
MCELQTLTNNKMFGEFWTECTFSSLPYYRATVVEAVEAIAKHGYKWWKQETTDLDGIKLELVDILHFTLSDFLRRHKEMRVVVAKYEQSSTRPISIHQIGRFNEDIYCFDGEGFEVKAVSPTVSRMLSLDSLTFNDLCEQLIYASLLEGYSDLPCLTLLFEYIGMSPDEVYLKYIAKNTLNHFRDDNGQKEGTYFRVWGGKDDDQVLAGYLNENPDVIRADLYSFLTDAYNTSHKTHKTL